MNSLVNLHSFRFCAEKKKCFDSATGASGAASPGKDKLCLEYCVCKCSRMEIVRGLGAGARRGRMICWERI